MPNPVWPGDLPQNVLIGATMLRETNVIRTPTDGGPAQVRRRSSSAVTRVSTPIVLTQAQRDSFDTFFETTLSDGALRFDWTHPVSGNTVEFRFLGPPLFSLGMSGNGPIWSTTLALEILP